MPKRRPMRSKTGLSPQVVVVVVVVVVVERGWCGWEWEARKTSDWEITLSLARAMPRAACGKASTRRLEERESVCVREREREKSRIKGHTGEHQQQH